jgi:hypothetical protein
MRTLLSTAAVAGAMLLLPSTTSANDNTAGVVGTGFLVGGFFASGMGGLVTDLGTGTSLATRNPALRSWGIASAVTGAANLGYSTLLLIGALQPSRCTGWFCMDFRTEFAVLAGVSGALGVSNAVLAGPIPLARRVFYLLAIYTGLRKSTLYRLRWSDLDLEHRTIVAKVTKNRHPQHFALPPGLVWVLRGWYLVQDRPAGTDPPKPPENAAFHDVPGRIVVPGVAGSNPVTHPRREKRRSITGTRLCSTASTASPHHEAFRGARGVE